MWKQLVQVSEWGINSEATPYQAYHIRLTNILVLMMLIGSIFQTIVCFATGAVQAGLINSSAPVVFGFTLYLMKLGYTVFARMFFLTISSIAAYFFISSLGPDTYFQFIYLFGSAFSFAIFSIEEKKSLIFSALTPLFCFVMLEATHYQPLFGMERAKFSVDQLATFRVLFMLLIWSIMLAHFFYFFRDRRRSHEQLISSAKMVAMGRMAAGIAHEVNNPLQVIVSSAERVKLAARDTGEVKEQLNKLSDQILSVSKRIGDINKGLLTIARDATYDDYEPVCVQGLVKLCLDFCQAHLNSNQIELRLDEIPKGLKVIGRETQLSEVILNIINNSSYAVQDSKTKIIDIKVTPSKRWVDIEIADSGPGVNPKVLHRIFDPFFTTKPVGKGTGLGLSISDSIMRAHGGKIYYEAKSAGARFVIRIPRVIEAEATLS